MALKCCEITCWMYIPEGNYQDSIALLVPSSSLSCRASFVRKAVWMNTRFKSVALRRRQWVRARSRETGTRVCHVPTAARARTHSGYFGFSLPLSHSLFFIHARFRTHVSPLFSPIDRIDDERTFTRRESPWAIDPIYLFSFSVQYLRRSRMLRSVPRIRGKRRHVKRLPTSMMQLAFNPHSRILELNLTVWCRTGLHWHRNCVYQNLLSS